MYLYIFINQCKFQNKNVVVWWYWNKFIYESSIRQTFHVFLFHIRNYSPKIRNVQRRFASLNITLPKVNNFYIKQKMAFFLFYTPKKSGWMLARHRTFQWQHNYIKKRTGTVIINYLMLIAVIIFCEITQPLLIINKSIEFELCYMKRTTLKLDPK